MDAPTPIPLETLLAHREWVRRVALALVRDENLAQDLEQDLWVKAIEKPPVVRGSIRGWLAATLRNTVVDRFRAESSRRRREQAAARPEAQPRADDVVAEAEGLKRVVNAVMDLEEPCRSAVLLRYFRDLPPREIAARQGVPVETVRTRLRRAIETLRERFDAESRGDRKSWCAALAPLAGTHERVPPAATVAGSAAAVSGSLALGGLLMAKKALAATAAAVLLLGTFGWWILRADGRAAPPDAPDRPQAAVLAALPTSDPVSPADAVQADATRAAGARLALRVVDSAGRPVAEARAALAKQPPKDESNPWRQRFSNPEAPSREFPRATGTEGTTEVDALPPGTYTLRVTAARFAVHQERVEVSRDGEELARTVVLLPSWTIEGTVFDTGGKALPGAEVLTEECSGRADASGRYRLEGLPPGTHYVSVRHGGALFLDMELVAVPGPRRLDLYLPGGAAIEGRVLDDATGGAVAAAQVFLLTSTVAPRGSRLRGSTHRGATDGAGSFRIGNVPPWTPAFLEVRAEGYLVFSGWYTSLFQPHYRFAPGDVLRVEVRLHAGSIVRGRVTGPGGTPVAGASVEVLGIRKSGDTDAATAAITGADGRYALRSPPGRGLLRVRAPGFVQPGLPEDPWEALRESRVPAECVVEVAREAETVRDVALLGAERAPAGSASISGRVRAEDGVPLGAAWVDVHGPGGAERRIAVLPEGEFRVEGLPPGDYGVTARCVGRLPGKVAVGALGEGERRIDVEVVVAPGRTLEGRVADDAGQPVAGATVRVSGASDGGGAGPVAAVCNEEGRFALAALPPGEVALEVAAWGFSPAVRTATAEDKRIDVVLERSLSISGVVVEEGSGRPVAGLLVLANRSTFRSGTLEIRETLTDAAGRFRISDLDSVQYDLATGRLADQGPAADFAPAKAAGVPAGQEDVRILVRPGLSIAGRVLDREGKPVPGGTIDANGPEGGAAVWKRETIGPDGGFLLRGLPEGLYALQVQPGNGLAPVRLPRVAAGTTDLEVRAGTGLQIKGRLLLEDGSPLPAGTGVCDLRSRNPDGSSTATTVGAWGRDGSFETGPLDAALVYDLVFHGRPGFVGGAVRGVAPGTENLVLVVQKGGSVEGRVVDRDGNGIPGIWVQAETRDIASSPYPEPGRYVSARTDGRGAFRLAGMAPVPYEVRAGGDGTDFLHARVKDPVEPGATGIVLQLDRGSFLEGRVVDASGAPWGEGFIQARGDGGYGTCRIDRSGEFRIRGIPPGEYTLHLQVGTGYVDLGIATAPAKDLTLRKPSE